MPHAKTIEVAHIATEVDADDDGDDVENDDHCERIE